ncbi:hypothetical protein MA16_Dca028465 [Dendrobium catenatum]|uniref:Uncharacterized protein n=1 Tax=Dendrobium catenatum TaxID=906689 RepID=A0A2I0VHF9_9ASPA|nr:hypothetical protein MA16_Dca028465 [Dendrobium catenatum]
MNRAGAELFDLFPALHSVHHEMVASGSAVAGRTNLQYTNGAGETEGTVRLFCDGSVSLNRTKNYIFCEGPPRG